MQIARLEASFAVQAYPDSMLRQEIAESLEFTEHMRWSIIVNNLSFAHA